MNIKNKTIILSAFLVLLLTMVSCVKENFDKPPTNCDDFNYTANFSIMELKDFLVGDTMKIDSNIIISGYISSTDLYGNFYKELVVEDTSGGICIQLEMTDYDLFSYYPIGQKVYIFCEGLHIGDDDGAIKLGSTYEEYGTTYFGRIVGDEIIMAHIIKTCDNNLVTPALITIPDINDDMLYSLVEIENVQFAEQDITWADAVNLLSINHNIEDADGNTLIVRTSGYASFAADSLPDGSGSIIGILGKYNEDYQLYVRSTDDADMTEPRF